MSASTSESIAADEHCEEKRVYYRSLAPSDAQTLMLERQSKTHKLSKKVHSSLDHLAEKLARDTETKEDICVRMEALETRINCYNKRQKEISAALQNVHEKTEQLHHIMQDWKLRNEESERNVFRAQRAEPCHNCFAEPFVALWRLITRRTSSRNAYSHLERGDDSRDTTVMVDDNELCVLSQFSKTE